jgi:Pyridoxamine 5'-phosphate oxidase
MLPDWPAGTVAVLVTVGAEPHAIPVSAVLRAGDDRILIGLAQGRESLKRLRAEPRVAVAVLAEGVALTARGHARVLEAALTDGVSAVEVTVQSVDDHLRPTFSLEAGVSWHWTEAAAQARDDEVRRALTRLAAKADGPRWP